MHSWRSSRVAAFLVVGLAVSGCADGEETEAAGGACTPTAASNIDALPADLRLPELGVFTRVEQKAGYLNAVSVTDGDVDTMLSPVSAALEDAGYSIIAQENEVIEADIFFAAGQRTTGGVKFINGPCEGQVTVRLFYSEV